MPPLKPNDRPRTSSIGMWIVAGFVVPAFAFLLSAFLTFLLFLPSYSSPGQRSGSIRYAAPNSEPSRSIPQPYDPEPQPSQPTALLPLPSIPEIPDSITSDDLASPSTPVFPPSNDFTALDVLLPEQVLALPETFSAQTPWLYDYRLETGSNTEPDVREGSLSLTLADKAKLDASIRSRSEISEALELPGSFLMNCVDSLRRTLGNRSQVLQTSATIESRLLALPTGHAISIEKDTAGTLLPFSIGELAFIPIGEMLNGEVTRSDLEIDLRGVIPKARQETLFSETGPNFFQLALTRYYSEYIRPEAPELAEVVFTRTYGMNLVDRTDTHLQINYRITTTYTRDRRPVAISDAGGLLVYSLGEQRILFNRISGTLKEPLSDGSFESKRFRLEISASDPWNSDRARTLTFPMSVRKPTSNAETPLAFESVTTRPQTGFGEETLSPDGRWMTVQSELGTLLMDRSQEGSPAVGYWHGGSRRCAWDRNSRTFVRLLLFDLDNPSERAEIIRLNESGEWESTQFVVDGLASNQTKKLAIDEANHRLFLFDSNQFKCIDTRTGETLWRKSNSQMKLPLSHWITETEMICLFERQLVRFDLTTGDFRVVKQFEVGEFEVPANLAAEAWLSYFGDDGESVWLKTRDGFQKFDTRTGMPQMTWEQIGSFNSYCVLPTTDNIVFVMGNEVIVADSQTKERLVSIPDNFEFRWPHGDLIYASDNAKVIVLPNSMSSMSGMTIALP